MNTFHLKYFIDAVRLGGVAASAEFNLVTHSAVSQSIRSLEKDLEVDLLVHEKKKFQVTEQGMDLYEKGRLWLQNLQSLKEEVKNSKEAVKGILTIASPQSVVREIIWKNLVQFRKLYPQVKVRVILGSADFVSSHVKKGTADIGFLLDQTDHSDLQSMNLNQGKYLLISKTPNAKLGSRPFIVTGQSRPEVQAVLRGIKKSLGEPADVILEIQSWSLIQKLVKDMDVFGLVPEFMVQNELQKGNLYKVKVDFALPDYEVLALWTSFSNQSNKVKAFLNLVSGPKEKK